jgi:hypothetical protein
MSTQNHQAGHRMTEQSRDHAPRVFRVRKERHSSCMAQPRLLMHFKVFGSSMHIVN